jgi:GNAT superfamily N-acetyltransferase
LAPPRAAPGRRSSAVGVLDQRTRARWGLPLCHTGAVSDQTLTEHTLGPSDASDALALSDAAGWNQCAEDWAVFIGHGQVRGRRSADGALVATGAALPYGQRQGWISMVLVAPAFRHRGLASELLNEGVDWLHQAGLTPVLDATPAGAQVYRRLGFVPGFEFQRWEGVATATERAPPGCADLQRIATLDAAASGVGRRFLLQDFLSRPATQAWMSPDGSGFVLSRAGRRAMQLGPLVAADERAALALLTGALDALGGPVFLDLPLRWAALSAALQQRGFRPQRPFVRMALGDAPALTGSERLFVVAGPEFG